MTMGRLTFLTLSFILCSTAVWAEEAGEQEDRNALAIRFTLEEATAKVQVVHNWLEKPDEKPRFQGFRFYTFDVPTDGKAHYVGWKPRGHDEDTYRTVIMNGKRFRYVHITMDRAENGTIVITPLKEKGSYRMEGVYCYFGELFVFDETLKVGEPLLLYEKAPNKRVEAESGQPRAGEGGQGER